MDKRGEILTENVIFIILNLVFISVLLLFVFTKMNDDSRLEEVYAKKIALIIDSAKPEYEIELSLNELYDNLGEGITRENVLSISENIVNVRLNQGTGYSYAFFNNVDVELDYSSGGKDVLMKFLEIENNEGKENE